MGSAEDQDRPIELVTVFASGDIAALAAAKLALEAEGIAFITKGEGVQDLFGLGRAFGGMNLVTGPVQLQVRSADAELALKLLSRTLGESA